MKKFLPFMIVLLFLVSGASWARHKKSSMEDSGSKRHKHHAKGEKGSSSKNGAEFKVESDINQSKMTFDFNDGKERVKIKKSGKKKKDASN